MNSHKASDFLLFLIIFSLKIDLVWFVFFVYWHLNLRRFFHDKDTLVENSRDGSLPLLGRDKGVYNFHNCINKKMNVIVRLEYFDVWLVGCLFCFMAYQPFSGH